MYRAKLSSRCLTQSPCESGVMRVQPFACVIPSTLPEFLQPFELLLARKVVANVAEKDGPALRGLWVLHQKRDRHRRTASAAEDFPSLLPRLLARGALVASQVEHVEAAELLGEALAQTVGGVRLDEARRS